MDQRRLVLASATVLAIATVIALAAIGVAVDGRRPAPPPPVRVAVRRPAPPRVPRDVPPPERAVLAASPDALTARLDARYALAPDARFALAVQHLAAFAAGDAAAPEVRASRDGWAVLVGGASVATLPPAVTFDAMLTAAVGFATGRDLPTQLQLVADVRPAPDALAPAMLRDPWAAARAAEARWTAGPHRVADLLALGRALTLTVALTRDPLGLADPVAGRALAALALARAADAPDPAAEALLCHAMTYVAEARARADALPPAHRAVGAWVRGDAEALRSLGGHGDAAARQLANALEPRSPARADLASARRAAEDIPGQVLTALERDEGAMSGAGAAAFARYAALETTEVAPGGWIDQAVTQARRRARWGDGLMQVLAAAQAAATTPAQAQEVIGRMGDPSDPLGAAWLSWARRHIVGGASGAARASLAQDAGSTAVLGVPAAVRSLRALAAEGLGGTAVVTVALQRLARQMDQRPAHQLALGVLLIDAALDLPRGEALLAAGVAQGPGVDTTAAARLGALRADRAGLLAIAQAGPAEGRITALRSLARAPAGDVAAQDAAWAALADEADGDGAETTAEWAAALLDRGEVPRARELLERWDGAHRGAAPTARVTVAAALGRVLLRMRDLPGAWRVLEPWATSDSVPALVTGARVLVELERFEDADRLARRAWDRDEHASTAALLAEACWRRNANAAAAEVLAPRVRLMTAATWEETVGPSFDAVFSGRSAAEGTAALGALGAEVGVRWRSALLDVMLRAGHGGIAAEIHESLHGEGDDQRELLLSRYAMRVAAEGELPAGEWLQGVVPATERAEIAELAYPRRLDEVLWAVVETPVSGAVGDRVWLLRAAASLRRGAEDPHRPDLLEHLRASNQGTWAYTLARHLFDLSTLDEARAQAETPRQEWQTGYFLGLKARAAGQMVAASEWFQGAMDPGDDAPLEAAWARAALREWVTAGRALPRREAPTAEE